jgi:hypothetical protein
MVVPFSENRWPIHYDRGVKAMPAILKLPPYDYFAIKSEGQDT